ncbi:MAG: hypothetical protein Q8M65_00445 [Rhodoglobus sp.]|nr:hypothetical protein [Rhodoglobus sp.]
MTIEKTAPSPPHETSDRRVYLRLADAGAIALALLINLALIVGLAWMLTHLQRVADQFAVWQFAPPAAVEAYADRAAFSDEGRFLFFASRPVIAADTEFNDVCASQLEEVGILGCYLPGDKRIFLFDVTDVRLDGIEEVVAAHEMLHAAWDRMTDAERTELGVLLEAEAEKHSEDPGFAETLEFYALTEPGERLNELHSIVGTKFDIVAPALEAHYAQFFTNRAAVVSLHEKSNAVFQEQAAAVAALIARIDELAAAIDADYASYNAQYGQLNVDIDSFNSRADSGDFGSQAEFNSERDALLARQRTLDAFYATIDARAAEYNVLLTQLDELNSAAAKLNEAINITPHETADSSG